MSPGEQFYPSFKKLVSLPEWKDYEAWLKEREQAHYLGFLMAQPDSDLKSLQSRANESMRIRNSIYQFISEVEESRKI